MNTDRKLLSVNQIYDVVQSILNLKPVNMYEMNELNAEKLKLRDVLNIELRIPEKNGSYTVVKIIDLFNQVYNEFKESGFKKDLEYKVYALFTYCDLENIKHILELETNN